jgi:putative acetyltransferase
MHTEVTSSPITIAIERPDQPEIVALLAELDAYLQPLYPPESNHILEVSALLLPEIRFFVARQDARPLGCGALKFEAGYGEIKRMFVRPAARGLGVAKLLLQWIETEAHRHRVAVLRLETGIHQAAAIGLYVAAGFAEIPPFGDYRPDPLSRFFGKRLTLPSPTELA